MAVIVGNNLNNVLTGFNGIDDIIAGQAGNDTLSGLSGNDTLKGGTGTDVLNGGLGTDTADYGNAVLDPTGPAGPVVTIGATAGVNVNLTLAGFQNTGGAGVDQLVSIENLVGTNFNDILIGNAGNNELCGLAGNDRLFGNAGNDTLNGGLGNDLLNGGIGIDTVDYSNKVVCGTPFAGATAGVRVNLNVQGIAQNTGGAGSDTLVSIENVTGSNFSDILIGNAGNNVLSGLAGNDLLVGGAGRDLLTGGGGTLAFDTFDYNAASDSLPGVLNRDVITDFNGRGVLAGDQIDLSTIDANPFLAGNQAFIWTGAAPGGLGRAWYSGGILRANTDFDAAPELEIQLVGAPALFVLAGHPGSDVLL